MNNQVNQSHLTIQPMYTKTLYCEECQEECEIIKNTEERYPGIYTISFLSSCCHSHLVDQYDKPLLYGELNRLYETQEGYKLYPFMD